jgi:hypothetical protein
MPDSNWGPVNGSDRTDLERQHGANNGELPGHKKTREERRDQVRPNTTHVTTIETYSQLTYAGVQPPNPQQVIQRCDKCGEHVDSLTNAQFQPISIHYEPAHVNTGQWGSRSGNLFQSVTVTGTVVRRITTQSVFSDGTSFSPAVRWERRAINHVENRPYVDWGGMTAVDCTHGIEPGSIRFTDLGEENVLLLAAVAGSGFLDRVSISDDALAIPHLIRTSKSVPHPVVRILPDGKDFAAVLSDFPPGGSPREVGRLHLELDPETAILNTVSWRDGGGTGSCG